MATITVRYKIRTEAAQILERKRIMILEKCEKVEKWSKNNPGASKKEYVDKREELLSEWTAGIDVSTGDYYLWLLLFHTNLLLMKIFV